VQRDGHGSSLAGAKDAAAKELRASARPQETRMDQDRYDDQDKHHADQFKVSAR
jgi:hypothetical protein